MTTRPRLAVRLMQAQALVIGVGGLTLIIAAVIVAPQLFHIHLIDSGVGDLESQLHAEEAFASSFAISVGVAVVAALLTAGAISWFLVRRVSRPVELLAQSAQAVAAGKFDVAVPDAAFSRELDQLSTSFSDMAHRLAETEVTRARLLADLAHELRTPLATLEAYIEGMEDGVLPTDAAAWGIMLAQVERLRRLASDLRVVAAAEEHALGLRLEPSDAALLASLAVAAAAPRDLAKGVGLHLTASHETLDVVVDAMRIEQVLANLLDNALRHTPAGGSVTVGARRGAGDIRIDVSDTGEGISPGQLSMIFERFYRADPSRVSADGGGSGLGLTIARAIIADHGGTIEASSAGSGRGTTFTIHLPSVPAARSARGTGPSSNRYLTSGQSTS